MIRILHFSDAHVQVPLWQMPLGSFLGKRLLGAANLRLRRGKFFRRAPHKLEHLAQLSEALKIDLAVFTGDCTALGTEPEYRAARSAMSAFMAPSRAFFLIPGNHDLYLADAVDERRFDRYFGDFLTTDLPELRVDGPWPIVRWVGEDVALVAINSAKPNPEPWRASGRVPEAQLHALTRALRHEQVAKRFVFVVTHYGPRRKDGTPDTSLHGFENGEAFLDACAGLRWGAIIHGHIHWHYCLQLDPVAPPIFCAGSATFEGREGFWVYEVDGDRMKAFSGRWTGSRYELEQVPKVEVKRF
jgi:3',5'-cyclic AMP phosphodiesterase CpdA